MRKHHTTHTWEKSNGCPFCGKSFTLSSNLKIHKLIHARNKEFSCDLCSFKSVKLLADQGEARGCSTKSLVHWFSNGLWKYLVPTALRRRHAQTIRDSSSSYKTDYVIVIKNFLNPKGHQNPISGSIVTAILLKGWILPIGGASAVEGLRSTGLSRLVYCTAAQECLHEQTR